jgi:hypothetical protein
MLYLALTGVNCAQPVYTPQYEITWKNQKI